MLIQFHFKNFKSFRDDTILDFSATESQDNEYRVAKVGDERILTAAGIFGANASGKSNVIKAFRYMKMDCQVYTRKQTFKKMLLLKIM